LVKVVLALEPMLPMAVKQTITIKANITAYSTAVGPSSETRNRRTAAEIFNMEGSENEVLVTAKKIPSGSSLRLDLEGTKRLRARLPPRRRRVGGPRAPAPS
jgi:hypothetical protein